LFRQAGKKSGRGGGVHVGASHLARRRAYRQSRTLLV
jgi:hypothetical protein